ncbi:hypothetical protein ANO11243_095690 [Dothideomycetidae sp. 11243]|nr:hypothetical protein ANO11243_095690 [fungal sp. No.11243]
MSTPDRVPSTMSTKVTATSPSSSATPVSDYSAPFYLQLAYGDPGSLVQGTNSAFSGYFLTYHNLSSQGKYYGAGDYLSLNHTSGQRFSLAKTTNYLVALSGNSDNVTDIVSLPFVSGLSGTNPVMTMSGNGMSNLIFTWNNSTTAMTATDTSGKPVFFHVCTGCGTAVPIMYASYAVSLLSYGFYQVTMVVTSITGPTVANTSPASSTTAKVPAATSSSQFTSPFFIQLTSSSKVTYNGCYLAFNARIPFGSGYDYMSIVTSTVARTSFVMDTTRNWLTNQVAANPTLGHDNVFNVDLRPGGPPTGLFGAGSVPNLLWNWNKVTNALTATDTKGTPVYFMTSYF